MARDPRHPAFPAFSPDVLTGHLAAIVESSDDAIISKTLDGTILSWNAGAERLYQYTADEMIGQPLSLIVPPDEPDELAGIMARLRRGERIEHYETERVRKDGRRVQVSVTISPVRNAAGEIVGASAIARDVGAQRRQERDAQAATERARRAAEEASRTKDEFLAMVSHELRTPLNAIAGWLHVLRAKRDDPALVERALDTVQRNTRLLTRIVDDLFDVSRF
ncbi:MAG TPA: PAS domain S-box protein, partial [Solirubrobacteraceae bacterium]|nr:PAS domain S-box protein [Solirubrobacteraceae bacterium]